MRNDATCRVGIRGVVALRGWLVEKREKSFFFFLSFRSIFDGVGRFLRKIFEAFSKFSFKVILIVVETFQLLLKF